MMDELTDLPDAAIDRVTAEQTTKNLALLERFMNEALADPVLLDRIPNGATIIFLPVDDPELARQNFSRALARAQAGKQVVLQVVGLPRPDAPAWQPSQIGTLALEMLTPRWPAQLVPEPGDLTIIYDRERDILLVDYFGLRQTALAIPLSGGVALRIDRQDPEVVGHILVGFLSDLVERAPHLASVLRRAEFRALTDEELGGLIPPPAPQATTANERQAAEALANELPRLIA